MLETLLTINSPDMNLLDKIQPFYVMQLLNRAKALEQAGADVVHMEIGEPDFPTPPLVVNAGIEFLSKGEVKYTPAAGLSALREAIARFTRNVTTWKRLSVESLSPPVLRGRCCWPWRACWNGAAKYCCPIRVIPVTPILCGCSAANRALFQ